MQQPHDGAVVDTAGDASADLDVWYTNPETGAVFGFGLPLPPSIPPQIAAGRLVPASGPDGHMLSAVPVPEADGAGPAGTEDDEPALYPCSECGDAAAKDADGFYTDRCAKHPLKTAARTSGKK